MEIFVGNAKAMDEGNLDSVELQEPKSLPGPTDIDEVNEATGLDLSVFDNGNFSFAVDFPDQLSNVEKLERWFAYLRSACVDIISQLNGSSSLFFIHAESLILKFSLDPLLRSDYNTTPQFLRLVFHIENFLSSLRQCGGTFRLIFFDFFKPLLQAISPSLAVLREAFLLLCQVSTNSTPLDYAVFPSSRDSAFCTYIEDWQPPFMLLDDCSALRYSDSGRLEDVDSLLWSIPYALVHDVLSWNIHAALLYDVRVKGRKVYCFCVSPPALPALDGAAKEVSEGGLAQAEASRARLPSAGELLKQFESSIEISHQYQHIGFRDFLIALFVRDNLEVDEQDPDAETNRDLLIFFCKLLLLSSQLCRLMPLQARSLLGFEFPHNDDKESLWAFSDTLELMSSFFFSEVTAFLESFVRTGCWERRRVTAFPSTLEASEQETFDTGLGKYWSLDVVRRDLVDFVDCRLIKILAVLIIQEAESLNDDWAVPKEFFNFPASVTQELDLFSSSFLGFPDASFFPVRLGSIRDQVSGSLNVVPRASLKENVETPELLVLRSQFFQKLMGTEDRKGYEYGNIPGATLVKEPSSFGVRFWKEGMGRFWTPSLLLDAAEFQIIHKLSVDNLASFIDERYLERFRGPQKEKMRQKLKLRIAQRGAARVHKFAASLGAPSRYHHSIKVSNPGQHVWSAMLAEADNDLSKQTQGKQDAQKKKDKSKGNQGKVNNGTSGKAKQSSKAEAIIKKNEELQRKKVLQTDTERLPGTLASVAAIGSKVLRPKEVCNRILDILVGPLRFTEEILSFPALTTFLTLPESQCQVLMAIIELLSRILQKHYTLEDLSACSTLAEEMHGLLCFAFQFIHQVYHLYKNVITVDDIKKLQRLLISLGFEHSAASLFTSWRALQLAKVAESEEDQVSASCSRSNPKGQKEVSSKVERKPKQRTTGASATLQTGCVSAKDVFRLPFAAPRNLENEIQMQYMGHQMRRSLGSAPDSRVKFNPDQWQVRLLDVIDQRRSALVCAPTGCGKTFVGYYAMEKVLSYDNDSVCVFVCPSKALVQQVQHEVKARFSSKEYPYGCHTVLSGVLLPRIDGDALKCQILLTLPSMLEMLLMSACYRDWVSRIKYVVLDEIHCIGEGDEEARAWERLIQLIRCPFIALSATVGNPGSFHQWLSNAHISGGDSGATRLVAGKPAVEVIHFDERYADLSCYVYVSEAVTQQKLQLPQLENGKTKEGGLVPLNPLVCVTYKQILYEGLTRSFYMPSGDTLKAYCILRDLLKMYYRINENGASESPQFSRLMPAQREEVVLFVNAMDPRYYFQNTAIISKRQYRYYLQWFTHSLTSMVQSGIISEQLFNIFIDGLVNTSPLRKRDEVLGGTIWAPCVHRASSSSLDATRQLVDTDASNVTDIVAYANPINTMIADDICRGESFSSMPALYEFCRNLHRLGLLPALMFNFSRAVVTHLFQGLLNYLVDMQTKKFYGTPEAAATTRALNKKRMDEYRALVKHHEMIEKLKTVSKRTREEEGIVIDESDVSPLPPPPIDIADEYDEEFNFSNRRVWSTHNDDIEEIILGVSERIRKKEAFYVEALRRGIGFHHNGLGRRYRAAVEMLFRMGFLRIVFSTETLSLGVNMPCKATVFLGDSVLLTPLLYRQTSGRAGRRGFDVMGHVVFWAMPFPKLRRLMCARLPVLSGEFTVTPTDVLRTYQLTASVKTMHHNQLCRVQKEGKQTELKKLESQLKKDEAVLEDSVLRLYRMPLLSVSTVDAADNLETLVRLRWAIKYAFRFAADLARRCNYLDANAHCVGLAGLTTFLYTDEPGNLGLAWALSSGAVEDWLNTPVQPAEVLPVDRGNAGAQFPPWLARRVIALIAYFIAPVRLNYNVYLRMKLARGIDPLLPPLPDVLNDALSSYDELVLKNAKDYVRCLASSIVNWENELRLPFSGIDFGKREYSPDAEDYSLDTVVNGKLQSMILHSVGRSPFTAISGRADTDFCSAYELCHSKPQEVYFEESFAGQAMPRNVMVDGKLRPLLSNYALHFFTYKSERRTVEASYVDPNEIWLGLTRFENALWSVKTFVEKSVFKLESAKEEDSSTSAAQAFLELLKQATTVFEQLKKAEAT